MFRVAANGGAGMGKLLTMLVLNGLAKNLEGGKCCAR
jgi:hypothetical protein